MKNKQLHLTSKSNCQLQQQQAGTVMMKYNWINQLGGCYHLHQYQMGTLTMTSWILLNQRGKRYHLQQYQMGKVMILLMQICTLVRSHQHHTGSRIWSFVSRTKRGALANRQTYKLIQQVAKARVPQPEWSLGHTCPG